jgi:hypothetical protein
MKTFIISFFVFHFSFFVFHLNVEAQNCLPEGIYFTCQADIDNFQVNYPGCTAIEGDVAIFGNDLTNLNGLSVLTYIGGRLEIDAYSLLANLTGLDNLTTIGGSFTINGWSGLSSLSGLESLITVGSDFNIVINELLDDLSGLDNLTSIGGSLRIGPEILGGTGPPTIEPNTCLVSLSGLYSLSSIGGNLSIFGNDALTSLAGLSNLSSIGGDLLIGFDFYSGIISGNSALTSLAGLDNIAAETITNITIVGNSSLTFCDVQCLCNYLASPNGIVNIYGNATGCMNPQEVAEGCGINLPCLPYGNYYIQSQAEIDSFQSVFPNCNNLEGKLQISGSDIINLNGLNYLNSISQLVIFGNPLLHDLTGLDSLNSIGSSVIYDNDSLNNLNGLAGLKIIRSLQIGVGIWNPPVIGNPLLEDISGLENIDPDSIEILCITGNTNLSDCAVQSICDYLALPNAWTVIGGNSAGCNSQLEVEAACGVGVEESAVGGQRSAVTCFPNPTTGPTEFLISNFNFQQVSLKIYNAQGQEVATVLEGKWPGDQVVRWDATALPAGIYFYRTSTIDNRQWEKS